MEWPDPAFRWVSRRAAPYRSHPPRSDPYPLGPDQRTADLSGFDTPPSAALTPQPLANPEGTTNDRTPRNAWRPQGMHTRQYAHAPFLHRRFPQADLVLSTTPAAASDT